MLKLKRLLLLLASGAVLFGEASNAGLCNFQSSRALTALNFCFIFDCQNGAIGGAIEFCGDQPEDDLFLDCPPDQP